jgi:hypothetical protein
LCTTACHRPQHPHPNVVKPAISAQGSHPLIWDGTLPEEARIQAVFLFILTFRKKTVRAIVKNQEYFHVSGYG